MEQAQPPIPSFELSGGALCLDFANTWGDRERPETDKLGGYDDLLAFGRQAGLLAAGEDTHLAGQAEERPQAAAEVLERSRSLRETLYRIFSALADSREPATEDLEELNAILPEALSHLRVEPRESGFVWTWAGADGPLDKPLWPVLRSAAELLTSEDRVQVRECAGATCTWLFLDRSRNRSRRWCSMETCGNRAKARRHYHRTVK
jgi:predicted RNA-binding Zn ribbon-like protein